MEQQLLQEQKKPNVLAFQVALLFAFYVIALTYVLELLGFGADAQNIGAMQKVLSMALTYLPFILAIYYVQAKHKKELGGYITFGRAFSAGFKVSAYSGLFVAILILIYYTLLNPAALTKILDAAVAQAGNNEQQLKGVEMMSKYMVYFMMFGIAVTYTILGLLVSLITSAIIKRDRPLHFEDPQ